MAAIEKRRCNWAGAANNCVRYHDREWGVPTVDDRVLFEFLILEGAQAGLSWSTILDKRDNYVAAFDQFDVVKVARYDARKIAALLQDEGIVRNRLKILSTVQNARAFLTVQNTCGSFASYLWDFVDRSPIQNRWHSGSQVPPSTPLSERLSRDLKRRGFKFVGPTIVYAYMQAVGLVNDHLIGCFRRREVAALGRSMTRPAPPQTASKI